MKAKLINESLLKNEFEKIQESDLFLWNSSLNNSTKLEIIEWYKNLSPNDKQFVDILRSEAYDKGSYNSIEDESI